MGTGFQRYWSIWLQTVNGEGWDEQNESNEEADLSDTTMTMNFISFTLNPEKNSWIM